MKGSTAGSPLAIKMQMHFTALEDSLHNIAIMHAAKFPFLICLERLQLTA